MNIGDEHLFVCVWLTADRFLSEMKQKSWNQKQASSPCWYPWALSNILQLQPPFRLFLSPMIHLWYIIWNAKSQRPSPHQKLKLCSTCFQRERVMWTEICSYQLAHSTQKKLTQSTLNILHTQLKSNSELSTLLAKFWIWKWWQLTQERKEMGPRAQP